MPPDTPISEPSLKYLEDMRLAASAVQQFIAGKTQADYEHSLLLQSAVERQLEIIGEALSQLARRDPPTATLIPGHRQLIAFRNLLIHGYADVDDALVWGAIHNDLPELTTLLDRLLADAPRP